MPSVNSEAFVRKGALAYEATRILRDGGKAQPVRLFSSGARGPHLGIPIADVESMEDDEFIEPMHAAYSAPIEFLRRPDVQMEHLEGWSRPTEASVTTRIYPGNHFFFLESAPRLLADFASELESSPCGPRA